MFPSNQKDPTTDALLFRGPQSNNQELSQFLRVVAEGEQGQAEMMLEKNKDLVLFSGSIKDLSGRTFENITGFQYACWALDWHMWKMLRKYLSNEEAAQQLSVLGSWVSKYGLHAGVPGGPLHTLATALKAYIDNYDAWHKEKNYIAMENSWSKQVGGAQRALPAHAIHEYCRPDRSFIPCPSFMEPTLPRTRKTEEGEWFTAVCNDGLLGEKFAVLRYNCTGARCALRMQLRVRRPERRGWWCDERVGDHKTVVSLANIRVQQRDQLISELGVDQQYTSIVYPHFYTLLDRR